MVQQLVEAGSPRFRWVTCDQWFGRDPGFLDGVAELDRWYVAEVPHETRVWLERPRTTVPPWSGRGRRPTRERLVPGEPQPQRLDKIAATLSPTDWQPYLIKEGSRGPMVAQFAFRRVVAVRNGLPGPEVWLLFRRSPGEEPELKVYLSNAPAKTPREQLVWVTGMRWPIETAIEECKSELGMDHYEVRTWPGWHHHMTECLLAHHFLVRARRRSKRGTRCPI